MSFIIENERIYTLRDIHEMTGHHIYTLRRWIKKDKLVAVKLGRAYHVDGLSLRKAFLGGKTEGGERHRLPNRFVRDDYERGEILETDGDAADAVDFQDDIA